MNPVLLKPQSEIGAQVVVHGKVHGNASARDYQRLKPTLLAKVIESFERLRGEADIVLVEGAGSAAEVNLRAGDIANMGFAVATDTPVILIGDIDRGGVIASLVGTHALLSAQERALTRGYLINKFRGDVSLFDGGLSVIGERTGMNAYGVVPYFANARRLPAEDAMAVEYAGEHSADTDDGDRPIRIAVPALSRVANFDDLDPLIAEPDVRLTFVRAGEAIAGDIDLIVLPGSKSTIADLEYLRAQGWDVDIAAHVRRGGWLLGICAGFQMLGRAVEDPMRIEGDRTSAQGLGLLALDTTLSARKSLVERNAREIESGETLSGYEMHMGETTGEALAQPWLTINGVTHGARSSDGRIAGAYLHGLFAADGFRHALLNRIRTRSRSAFVFDARIEQTLDELAEHLERHVQVDALLEAVK